MSYLVFARKWRPLTFDDVVGQAHITDTLKRAIEKNRVAHGYIFSGTRGVGKTTTARILARALNCEKGPTPEPCGTCENCKSIINGSSFDVLEIDGASNSSVEDIRELRENIGYGSMGGKFRIYVIDEVHMLSKSAFNALLKTLEEPPKNVIFIFATTEPQKIPETIHSRCQRYDFRRISTEQILGQLEKICAQEKMSFEKAGLALIARRADGSMRDSLSLLDQVCSFCQDNITEREVRSVLGIVESELYDAVLDSVARKEPLPVLRAIEDVLNRGFDLIEFIVGFQEYLRTLLFIRLPGVAEDQRIAPSMGALRSRSDSASRFSEADLLRMIETVRRAESELRWSSFPRFCVEMMLVKLVYMDSTVSVEQILASLKNGAVPEALAPEGKKKSNDQPVTRQEHVLPAAEAKAQAVVSRPQEIDIRSSEPERPAAADPVDLGAQWPKFIERIMDERPNLGTFLSMAYLAGHTDHSVDIRFKPQFGFQCAEVSKKSSREIIEKKLEAFAGRPVELHITQEKAGHAALDTQEVNPQPTGNPLPPSVEDDIENEPIIQSVITIFNGKVI
jgi:DNA polymerase-3 subunit gamma/tau